MNKTNWGGRREGSGRCRLEDTEKRHGVKIYLTQKLKEEISEYGKGKSLSEKAVELLEAEITKRKK